jgi:lysophospholipase L1-like esterase
VQTAFDHFIALGDSISIDLYPALDAGGRGEAERGLGAASLLYRNHDDRWPEFRGRDLSTLIPRIRYRDGHDFSSPSRLPSDNLTVDGATTSDVLERQIPLVEPSEEATIVTVTAGGNDMLQYLGSRRVPADLVDGMIDRLHRMVREIRDRLPRSTILLGTVYDPSDGTNVLHGIRHDREAEWLARFNDEVRRIATGDAIRLIDIHRHFLGHGITAPEADRWYWSGLIFEPNLRGASEVRRLWLEALGIEN